METLVLSERSCSRTISGCRRNLRTVDGVLNPPASRTFATARDALGNSAAALIDQVGETVNVPATPFRVVPGFQHLHGF